jgi:RNA-directed DNA polymerase
MDYNFVNWRAAYKWLEEKQFQLVDVYEKGGDKKKLRSIQVSMLKDFRLAAIAVRRVVNNKGAISPGVDNYIIDTAEKRKDFTLEIHILLRNPAQYKAKAVKRVWIPKGDSLTEKRPLGLPTMKDRAVQAAYLEIIDPIVECNSCNDSFGFRKYRSGKDAVICLRGKLIHPSAAEWVLSADISKCFDRISHDYLLRSVPVYRKVDRNIIKSMLKAKILDGNSLVTNEVGTPQGGVLSPTLANIALNGLESHVKKEAELYYSQKNLKKPTNLKVHVVRYADDFNVIAPTKEMLCFLKTKIEFFLLERGLELSEVKTKMFNIWQQNLEFLGFTFRKVRFDYRSRAEISWEKRKSKSLSRITVLPKESKIKNFRKKVAFLIDKTDDITRLIEDLNNYIRGFSNYFNATSTSAEEIRKLGDFVFHKCWHKIKKQNPTAKLKDLKERFFPEGKFYQNGRYVYRNWVFSAPTHFKRPSDLDAKIRLYNMDSVCAPGLAQSKKGLNPYKPIDAQYLISKKKLVSNNQIEKLAAIQDYKCSVCNNALDNGEILEVHHVPDFKTWNRLKSDKRLIESGKIAKQALHQICHRQLHKIKDKS